MGDVAVREDVGFFDQGLAHRIDVRLRMDGELGAQAETDPVPPYRSARRGEACPRDTDEGGSEKVTLYCILYSAQPRNFEIVYIDQRQTDRQTYNITDWLNKSLIDR